MNELQVFNYNEKEVRTVQKDNETWWVLKDVCEILDISHIKDTVNRLEEDEVGQTEVTDRLGRKQTMNIINESGLYNVILRSDKPEAKPFRKWVTGEVLPSIRKHGAYMTSAKIEEVLLNPDTIIKLATDLKAEKEKRTLLELETKQKDQIIGELKPKADYTDRILQSKSLVNINQIAKDYGMSAKTMNKTLHGLGVQYKQGKQWLLYRKHQGKGYTSSETFEFTHRNGLLDVNMRTKWTQKGRLFLYNLLKENGIVPLIEQEIKMA